MRHIAILQRISHILRDTDMIDAKDPLELLETLRKLGAVSLEDQERAAKNPNQPNLQPLAAIWNAIDLGVERGIFARIDAGYSIALILQRNSTPKTTAKEYRAKLTKNQYRRDVFKHVRGAHHLAYIND